MNTSNLGTISNVGASRLDKAIQIAQENCCLDATGDGIAFIDMSDEIMKEKLLEAKIIERSDCVEIEKSTICTLLLTK